MDGHVTTNWARKGRLHGLVDDLNHGGLLSLDIVGLNLGALSMRLVVGIDAIDDVLDVVDNVSVTVEVPVRVGHLVQSVAADTVRRDVRGIKEGRRGKSFGFTSRKRREWSPQPLDILATELQSRTRLGGKSPSGTRTAAIGGRTKVVTIESRSVSFDGGERQIVSGMLMLREMREPRPAEVEAQDDGTMLGPGLTQD